MSEKTYDAIVLGAGPAGEVVAGRLADAGWKVAIVEKDLVGGECSYYACMPSKALLRPADVLAEAKRIPGVPVDEDAELDPAAILARRDEVIHGEDDSGQLPWLEEREIDLFRGDGRFVGEGGSPSATTSWSPTRAMIVATGSGAAMPPIDGLDSVPPGTTATRRPPKEVPASMIVLGGGPVGSELSQAWASLGTKVTLIDAGDHLLGRDEPFAGEEVATALRGRFGVDVRVGAQVDSVRAGGAGIVVELEDGGTVDAERLLVAVGRKPHTDGIGLDAIGVEPDEHGYVEVDDRMRVGGQRRTSSRSATSTAARSSPTSASTRPGSSPRTCSAARPGRSPKGSARRASPSPTRRSPRSARRSPRPKRRGSTPARSRCPTDGSPGASFQGKGTGGRSRLVVDRATDTIVGATFTGFETADFLQAATIAIVAEVPRARLRHAIAAYPTRSEVWLKLLEKWEAGD